MLTTTFDIKTISAISFVCFFRFRLYELRWDLGVKFYFQCFRFSVEKKELIPFQKNVLVLVFRLIWKFQKTKPETANSFVCENIRPEVSFCEEIISDVSRSAYVY